MKPSTFWSPLGRNLEIDLARPHQLGQRVIHRLHPVATPGLHGAANQVTLPS